ncbi:MAG: ABC transporter ATP-binding protein [Dehalococcoidia bacterium]
MTLDFRAAVQLGPFKYEAALCAAGEILVLFGHSGAGKSVTLQLIAGLLRPDAGRILVDGRCVFDSATRTNVPPQDRQVGYVVQDLALFDHMTVRQNIEFGVPRGVPSSRVDDLMAMLGITGLEKRRPRTLSGGQQQRVALARALAREGRLLLLDEPFSALDESLRAALRRELLRLRRDLGLTIVFVTHDLREAHLLADQLAVFDEGALLQVGPREEVFRRPLSRRVAELTGVTNIARGVVLDTEPSQTIVEVLGLPLHIERPAGASAFSPGTGVDLAIRAERVNLRRLDPETPALNVLEVDIVEEFAYGSTHTLHLRPTGPGPALEVEIAARPYEILDVVNRRRWLVELPPADLHIMPVSPSVAPS